MFLSESPGYHCGQLWLPDDGLWERTEFGDIWVCCHLSCFEVMGFLQIGNSQAMVVGAVFLYTDSGFYFSIRAWLKER